MLTLQPYKGPATRYHCPQCRDRQKTFTRYIDTDTGQQLADHVGRCSREVKCGYHYKPKEYFAEQRLSGTNCHAEQQSKHARSEQDSVSQRRPSTTAQADMTAAQAGTRTTQADKISFMPEQPFISSLQQHKPIHTIAARNNFVQYLISRFGANAAQDAVTRYLIGTSNHRFTNSAYPGYTSPAGATVFWQGDDEFRVRTGKIMLYDAATGKRVKEPFNHITWAHTLLKQPDYHLQQCLFGAHLLPLYGGQKPVAIVESEKTAIIASIHLPESIWLAAGSLSNLNEAKCVPLQGRKVTLYPDLGCYDKWCKKAKELAYITRMKVSAMLEQNATALARQQGYDLADYLAG